MEGGKNSKNSRSMLTIGGSSYSHSRTSIREANEHLKEVHRQLDELRRELHIERDKSERLGRELSDMHQTYRALERTRDDLQILVARLEERELEAKRESQQKLMQISKLFNQLQDLMVKNVRGNSCERNNNIVGEKTNETNDGPNHYNECDGGGDIRSPKSKFTKTVFSSPNKV